MKYVITICFSISALLFSNGCFVDLVKHQNKKNLLESDEEWHVYEIVLKDGTRLTPTDKYESNMEFDVDENRIFGVAACNNYFATFSLKGKKMRISEKGNSRKLCFPREGMEYERAFLGGLEGSFTVSRENELMQLKGKNATYYLRLTQ